MEEKIIVRLEADIADLKTQLNAAQAEIKRFGLGVETSINAITLDRLNLQLKQLQTQLGATDIGSIAFKNIGTQIATVESQINGALTSINQNANRSRSGFNGLSNSINQLSRELPAFGLSANIGFLAISNNLPILFDEIKKVRDVNADLAASGKTTTSVFKQLTGALFSWQTALSVGVTLLTVYGGKIIELISNIGKAKETITSTQLELNSLNEAYKDKSITTAISDVILLKSSIETAGKSINTQKTFVDQYNKTIGTVTGSVNTFKAAEQGIIDNTNAYVNAMIARAVATKSSEKAAEIVMKMADLRTENAKQNAIDQIDGEKKYTSEWNRLINSQGVALLEGYSNRAAYVKAKIAQDKANRHLAQQEELSSYQKQLDALTALTKKYVDKSGVITPYVAPDAASQDRGIPEMALMVDSSAQIEEAKKLFDFFKQQGPESFNLLGEAYINNPFFKDLIDEELSKNTLKLREDFDKLGKSPTWTDPAMLQYIQNLQNIANLIGNTLNSAFESALVSGENFFKVMWRGLTNLLYKLAAAAVAALVLSVLLAPWSGGAALAAVGGFEGIFSKLTGFDISGIGGGDSSVFMPNNAVGQGNYQIDIMGDKMRLLLDNTAIKNTRVI
jgi:hypothetical protein